MSPDHPRWRTLPILRALHDQWWNARAGRLGASSLPYSRDWEQLLESAGLVSAVLRGEADRDARAVAAGGLLRLKFARYRPHVIERVLVPVGNEYRLAALFGDPTDAPESRRDPATIPWEPELAFLREGRPGLPWEDLERLNRFLAEGGRLRPIVPIKERSLQIFGDEKRLDALMVTAPFRTGRLSPDLLRCVPVPEPLGWRRGPNPHGPVLVLENASTWDSYGRWNERSREFSAVVYGKGLVFADSVTRLADIFQEIGAVRPIQYFGDLDPPGVEIPHRASRKAEAAGYGRVTPHPWSYRRLLEVGAGHEAVWEGEPADEDTLSWLGDLAEPARVLFARHLRLAQEHVGWEFLALSAPN